ncbi:hypothetical protein PTTG_26370 [Puccinia triticina 1-1 BBBD Race 1]|uniref:Uncharacterized protein n=1 Tax=Puccinia triticina (isolate 1-1 / race 1 (BBBD)) TaxID=630390 RepID=A0A180GWL0_PUCT1|nr:hypothetical protein PTTG_26370 [Puccinia triticina 1-1 BBBD Race 1]
MSQSNNPSQSTGPAAPQETSQTRQPNNTGQNRRQNGRLARQNAQAPNSTQRRSQGPNRSWTTNRNNDGQSSLDLVVEWLTVEGNYELWWSGRRSQREVAEMIGQYLVHNGAISREWRGIKQQISGLEQKFRDALPWRNQTGQGILDEAEELERSMGADPDDFEADDLVGAARNQTEAAILKKCKYYYELEPIMVDRPAAIPLDVHKQGNKGEIDLAAALSLHGTQETPTMPAEWEETARNVSDNPQDHPDTTSIKQPPLPPTMPPENSPAQTNGQTNCRTNYAKRITERIFPTREDMMAQTNAELELTRERLNSDIRMVDANVQLAAALSNGLDGETGDPERHTLQIKQMRLEIQFREMEIACVRASIAESEQLSSGLFAQAKMVQDFVQSGLTLEDALNMTTRFLGPD